MTVSQGAAANLIIRQPGAAGGPWSAAETPYMVEPMDTLASRGHEAVVFVGPARTGKALDLDTPIPTPAGWTTMGALHPGHSIFGADGKVIKVLEAHAVMYEHPCYRVTFSDGTDIVADAEHLWGVERFYWREPNWRYEVRTTEQMLGDLKYAKNRYRYRIANPKPLELPDQSLVIDPYVLGLWLGNGRSTTGILTSHADDVPHVETAIRASGWNTITKPDKPGSLAMNTRIEVDDLFGHFNVYLRMLNLIENKHIPLRYLRASATQRLSLLRGLMDSDGTISKTANSCEFTTVRDNLASDFSELARSLGLKPRAVQKKTSWVHKGVRKHSTCWRITFPVPHGLNPFTLPRKANLAGGSDVDVVGYRQIVSIESVVSRPVRCIKVDAPDSLFLAGPGMVPTHNTAGLLLGWMSHNIVNDPGDMLFLQMSKTKAREFSKTDVDRSIRNSPSVRAMLSPRAVDSNTFDIMFRHGMWLRVAWPTVDNVSGSTYRYVAITDIDRIENAENVDGEGPLFDLAKKRTTTFLSRGMTLVESSPGYPLEDPSWQPATAHEAPPTRGILSLYNRSDRRRWYWQCPDCSAHFEAAPGLGLFRLPSIEELLESVRTMNVPTFARERAEAVCPHCQCLIPSTHKQHMNAHGVWVPDGAHLADDGQLLGDPIKSTIRGYWLGGVAAGYQSWQSMIEQHLMGLREYALTGSEEKLKQTTNTDQGAPYMSRRLVEARGNNLSPKDKAEMGMARHMCPPETRCLLASVDVQGGQNARFEVEVHAIGVDGEEWLVDRFPIKWSNRSGVTPDEPAPIDPAKYAEDWDVLTEKILRATWQTPIEGVEMQVAAVIVDTGGEEGATELAYAWYRRMRALDIATRGETGYVRRIRLYKGGSTRNAPILRETEVGKIAEGGVNDIPLLLCNTNLLSDAVDAGLKRQTPGPNYYHFPAPLHPVKNPNGWLTEAFFDELAAEIRGADGTWSKIRKRNEAFDLCRMIYALKLNLGIYKVTDWDAVPAWLAPLERNSHTMTAATRRELQANTTVAQPTATIVRKKRRKFMMGG